MVALSQRGHENSSMSYPLHLGEAPNELLLILVAYMRHGKQELNWNSMLLVLRRTVFDVAAYWAFTGVLYGGMFLYLANGIRNRLVGLNRHVSMVTRETDPVVVEPLELKRRMYTVLRAVLFIYVCLEVAIHSSAESDGTDKRLVPLCCRISIAREQWCTSSTERLPLADDSRPNGVSALRWKLLLSPM